jgi:foldase protein PrsA
MNKEKVVSIVVLVLIVGAIAGFAVFGSKKKGETAMTASSTPVATVNGVDISEANFDTQLAAAITSLKGQGVDTTSTTSMQTIKQQVLDNMIATELVTQGVAKAGIKASDSDVEAQHAALVTQAGGQDKFNEQLTAANLTDAQLRANIASQLAIQTFLLQNISTSSATVTEAEMKQFYDDNTKGQTDVPKYADVKAQIEQQLVQQKQQALVNDFIAKLKAQATITTNLK